MLAAPSTERAGECIMIKPPSLLNYGASVIFGKELLCDIRLDKLLSKETQEILCCPCKEGEIKRRNRVFGLLESTTALKRVEGLLSLILTLEKCLGLVNCEKTPLSKYFRYAQLLDAYICVCEAISELGDVFVEAGAFYSSDEFRCRLSEIRLSSNIIKDLLERMRIGLLSFSDKCWITPDNGSVSEFDLIADCASRLGFTVPAKNTQKTKVDTQLSDAVCRLYAESVSEIEAEMKKHSFAELSAPLTYISELNFYLETARLTKRAEGCGVKYCFAEIADSPLYKAEGLCDISLLIKNCESIVPNGLALTAQEPFSFVIGANGGGKTTYLRAAGINLILFLAGCPVFAEKAEIYPFDCVLSHFPKDERFDDVGRLDEELSRTEKQLAEAQGKTAFFLYNEAYSGANEKRGFELLCDTVKRITDNGHFGLYVTHFHGVKGLEYPVLSAAVDPDNKNERTYKIVRSKGSASSYASDILRKYRLDKESLEKRRAGYGN